MSKAQRKQYIAAVQCMQAKPSILPAGTSAGSKSLFDDFVYVHMQSTMFIHFTVRDRAVSKAEVQPRS
jgi:tyrosinase